MNRIFIVLITTLMLVSCGTKKQSLDTRVLMPTVSSSQTEPFVDINEYSEDKEYGLVGDKPIKVGDRSAANQRRYIASLAGPNGEELSFSRQGSCCGYKSENGFGGIALVDVYKVTYKGLEEPIMLYISFYDFEKLYIPHGFTKRKL